VATPTVSSITPDTGYFVGMWRVDLVGTNFIVSADAFGFDYDPSDIDEVFQKVPTNNPVFPTPLPTPRMKVVVEVGAATYEVTPHVESATKMWFLMPRLHATGNTDRDINWTESAGLRITPLTILGAPILVDELLIADAITLTLPKTGRDSAGNLTSPHSIVVNKLINDLRSFVQPNSSLIPYINYEGEDVVAIRPGSKLPALVLNGPDITESFIKAKKFQRLTLSDGSSAIQMTSARSRDLVFDVFILDDSQMHILDMCNLLETYIQRSQYFVYTVMKAAAEPLLVVSYLSFERSPGIDNIPALLGSSVRQGRARIRIASVPVGYFADPTQNTVRTNPELVETSIIHQTSKSVTDEQPDNDADIIEG
jgi:hypothetical protein